MITHLALNLILEDVHGPGLWVIHGIASRFVMLIRGGATMADDTRELVYP